MLCVVQNLFCLSLHMTSFTALQRWRNFNYWLFCRVDTSTSALWCSTFNASHGFAKLSVEFLFWRSRAIAIHWGFEWSCKRNYPAIYNQLIMHQCLHTISLTYIYRSVIYVHRISCYESAQRRKRFAQSDATFIYNVLLFLYIGILLNVDLLVSRRLAKRVRIYSLRLLRPLPTVLWSIFIDWFISDAIKGKRMRNKSSSLRNE